jgi:hypothetical protein
MEKLKNRLKPIILLSMIHFLVTTSCLPAAPTTTTSLITPSATTTQQATPSPTFVPPTPTPPATRIEQKCAQFVEDSPSTIFDGTIVLDRYKQGEKGSPLYFLDLKTNHQIHLSNSAGVAISPDGNTVAYSDLDFDLVNVADTTGILMQIPEEPGVDLKPIGWLDNHRLMLDRFQWDSNEERVLSKSLVVLDIATGEKEEWLQEYPNFDNIPNDVYWSSGSNIILNPKFRYLIYPVREGALSDIEEGAVLWDIDSQREVTRIYGALSATYPNWSPDGTRFVISVPPNVQDYTADDGLPYKNGTELFLISITGKVERLTYFTVEETSFQDFYKWSPDGQYIAFLLQTGSFGGIGSGDLAIINVETGKVTQYCVSGSLDWTSDGKYILFSQAYDNFGGRVYLLDIQSAKAYLIMEDAVTYGGTIRSP